MANDSLKHDTGVLQTSPVQGRKEMACDGTGLTSPASVAPELCLGGARAHGGKAPSIVHSQTPVGQGQHPKGGATGPVVSCQN